MVSNNVLVIFIMILKSLVVVMTALELAVSKSSGGLMLLETHRIVFVDIKLFSSNLEWEKLKQVYLKYTQILKYEN